MWTHRVFLKRSTLWFFVASQSDFFNSKKYVIEILNLRIFDKISLILITYKTIINNWIFETGHVSSTTETIDRSFGESPIGVRDGRAQ